MTINPEEILDEKGVAVEFRLCSDRMDMRREDRETNKSRIRLIPFSDIVLSPARRDLVKGIIPRVGLSVIWGPPKCGKSFWTFDLAMHVALGWDYRGRKVHGGPVVYCAFEGQSGMEQRKAAFQQRLMAGAQGAPAFYLQPVRLDLIKEHPDLIAAIQDQLGDTPPVLIVLDTLNRSIRGSESNDEDMGAYIGAADAIREAFNCAVVIVHHCGVEGSRPRGHTSLTGAVEAQLAVKRDAEDKIVVEVELAKDGPQGEQIVSRLEVVEVGGDEDGAAIASCVVIPTDDTPAKAKAKLSAATRAALDLLIRAINDHGQQAPEGAHYPRDIHVVPLDVWRRYCYDGMGEGRDNPETSRKAFSRARLNLQNSGRIGTWEQHVWVLWPRGTSGT